MLRDYRKGDEDSIFALVKVVLAGYGLEANPLETDRDLSDIQQHYLSKGGCFRVIEDDGRIVGSYGLYVISEGVCELRKMYLLPAYHGRGLGKAMMEDAMTFARTNEVKELILETNSRLKAALTLYSKYGFEPYAAEHLSDRCDTAMRLKL